MSESRSILVETADRLFGDLAAAERPDLEALWPKLEEAGFPLLLTPEADGGFGGDWGDAFAVLRLAGFHVLAAPLAEAVVAGWAASGGGLPAPEGLCTVAPHAEGHIDNGAFTGRLSGVPWGGAAAYVMAEAGGRLVRLRISDAVTVEERANPAREPRSAVVFEGAAAEVGEETVDLFGWGALARTAQIAGALDAALALSIRHANERIQFGRPIGKFQAVQQSLAIFAEEAAAVNCAGQAAAQAADRGDAAFEAAAAKLRANQAAGSGTTIAHQVHGAIGFTQEHPLHRLTLRLHAWRAEFGNDRYWGARLGAYVAGLGADGLWPELTRRSDPL
jgi:acyl-CoA dehydrogenase